jgi:hypothetical protein
MLSVLFILAAAVAAHKPLQYPLGEGVIPLSRNNVTAIETVVVEENIRFGLPF